MIFQNIVRTALPGDLCTRLAGHIRSRLFYLLMKFSATTALSLRIDQWTASAIRETIMKLQNTIDAEWPTFRGRHLTAKEREFGLVITPISPKDVQKPGRLISSNQLWIGRCGRLFFELCYGGYPLETIDNRSTLTSQGVRELNAEALRIHDSITEIAEEQERERLAAERQDSESLSRNERSSFQLQVDRKIKALRSGKNTRRYASAIHRRLSRGEPISVAVSKL